MSSTHGADPSPVVWQALGQTVRGASHQRSGLPNQDALGLPAERVGPPLLVAIADGHGSAKYFRSDRGSRFAVEAATEVLGQILADIQALAVGPPAAEAEEDDGAATEPAPPEPAPEPPTAPPVEPDHASLIKRAAETKLPLEVVRLWQRKVDADLAAEPITDEEWDRLVKRDGAEARAAVETDLRRAYGATVLACLVTADFVLYVQLGDGDILQVWPDGTVDRPLPDDPRLLANETTSLCSSRPQNDFRIRFQPLVGGPGRPRLPELILLATDGYSNSFADAAGFAQVASDLNSEIKARGCATVEAQLTGWLNEASRVGSGDDITVALLKRLVAEDRDAMERTLHDVAAGVDRHEVAVVEHQTAIEQLKRADDDTATGLRNLGERVTDVAQAAAAESDRLVARLQAQAEGLEATRTEHRRLARQQQVCQAGIGFLLAVVVTLAGLGYWQHRQIAGLQGEAVALRTSVATAQAAAAAAKGTADEAARNAQEALRSVPPVADETPDLERPAAVTAPQ